MLLGCVNAQLYYGIHWQGMRDINSIAHPMLILLDNRVPLPTDLHF